MRQLLVNTMTKEETKHAIAIMQAYVDGKDIEYKDYNDRSRYWNEANFPNWNWFSTNYRIKPEIKYRPYNCVEEFLQAQKEHGPYIKNLTLSEHYYLPTEVFSNINDDKFTVKFSDGIDITNDRLANKEEWQRLDGEPCCKLL